MMISTIPNSTNSHSTSTKTPPELGLVCITTSDKVRYRALTRKRLLQLATAEQQQVLRELYTDNLQRLNNALDFCVENNLRLYRLPSGIFPFADTDLGEAVLEEFTEQVRATGDRGCPNKSIFRACICRILILFSMTEGVSELRTTN